MSATVRFELTPTKDATELRLLADASHLPVGEWAMSDHPGVDLVNRWLVSDLAIEGDDVILVEHVAIARLTAAEASRLDLPPATALRAVVEGNGVMVRQDFVVSLRWTRPSGQNAPGVDRVGAWLREAAGWRRLPETLFVVAEAVSAHTAAAGDAARLGALAGLRRALPNAALSGTAEASGLLGAVTIIEADALSLDTVGEGDNIRIIPVLHRAGDILESDPLLPEDRQRLFGEQQFHKWPTARSVYSLPGNIYVTISPPLRQALEVVRRVSSRPPAERRAFLREPRSAIRAAIGDETDAAVVDALVVETPIWSERVIGLGLWQPRVLPWIALAGNDWFGEDAGTSPRGLTVDGQSVPLAPSDATALAGEVQQAMGNGLSVVSVATPDGPVDLPATPQTLEALGALVPQPEADRPSFVIIRPNETARDIEAMAHARPEPIIQLPRCLYTTLKVHQEEGLLWLQRSWQAGSPGVLLADDMGLGKTLQGLAFLAACRSDFAVF